MTAANWPNCLQAILDFEGGFVNNPADPGGATNLGITLATLKSYNPADTTDDLKALTRTSPIVSFIYSTGYWRPVRGDDLPSGVDLIVFDASVNQGPRTAARTLQKAVGVTADGIIGPATLTAVGCFAAPTLIDAIATAREAEYRADAGFATFGKGWLARLDHCQALAVSMTRQTVV